MYAIVKTGGKQYRVSPNEKLKIEKINTKVGEEITFGQVLSVGEGEKLKIGKPLLTSASVKATVLSHGRHNKAVIFKMRRRKHYQRRQGHRQDYTEICIQSIVA